MQNGEGRIGLVPILRTSFGTHEFLRHTNVHLRPPDGSARSASGLADDVEEYRGTTLKRPQGHGAMRAPAGDLLFTQAKSANDLLISLAVLAGEIFEQMVTTADELQQSTAGRVVFLVFFKVFAELVDPGGEKRDLHFR